MTPGARDLLLGLMLAGLAPLGLRDPEAIALGRVVPGPSCAVPVQQDPGGVRCWSRAEARAASLVPGDRTAHGRRIGRMPPGRLAALAVAIDPNRASAAELASLEGIGPGLARRIVAARPFSDLAQLARVRGVGRRRIARLRPRLTLDD